MQSESATPCSWRYLGLELKQRYQKNMVVSMSIVYLPIAIAGLLCGLLPGNPTNLAMERVMNHSDAQVDSSSAGTSVDHESPVGDKTGKGSPAMLLQNAPLNGFMSNIRIIPDGKPEVATPFVSMILDTHGPVLDTDFDPRLLLASGDGAPSRVGTSDFGLPPSNPYMPMPVWARSLSGLSQQYIQIPADRTTRDVSIIPKEASPRWPKKGLGVDSAVVVVRFDVTTNGIIRNLTILNETPADIGFAEQLIAWLDESYIRVQMVDGQKVITTVTLNYLFDPNSKGKTTVTSSSGPIDFQVGL